MLRLDLKEIKIKKPGDLVNLISEGRVDQKQIIKFVQPNTVHKMHILTNMRANSYERLKGKPHLYLKGH